MSTAWTSRYALRTKGIKSSAIRELLKITQRSEVISFAGGLPAPEVFPIQRSRKRATECWSRMVLRRCSTAQLKVMSLCAR